MPTSLIQTIALVPHPETRNGAVRRIDARAEKAPDGKLTVTYVLEADLDRVRVPAPRAARMADGLWQHTCGEIFIARKEAAAYHEFNLAPSGEWAAYAFERYRERAPRDPHADVERLNPHIAVRRTADQLTLDAAIPLDHLSPALSTTALSIALSMVIEDRDGVLSYWALAHPPGKPDFHHPKAFALELA